MTLKSESICSNHPLRDLSGELKVYFLPVEEIVKKYGPPKIALRRRYNGAIDYQSIIAAVRTSTGPEEAAELLNIKPDDLREYFRLYKILPRYGLALKEKEAEEEVFTANEPTKNVNMERKVPDKLTRDWLAEELKTRTVEAIQADYPANIKVKFFAVKWGLVEKSKPDDLLPYEKLVEYKRNGLNDRKIIKMTGIAAKDYYMLKEKYGLKERTEKAAPPEKETPAPAQATGMEKQEALWTGDRMTVARAVEIREEVIEDLDDLTIIIDLISSGGSTPPSERIMKLLTWYRDQYQDLLNHIDQVFSGMEVII